MYYIFCSLGNCKDKLDTCPAWKKEGECTKVESQTFMTKYCKKTCNKCDDGKFNFCQFSFMILRF